MSNPRMHLRSSSITVAPATGTATSNVQRTLSTSVAASCPSNRATRTADAMRSLLSSERIYADYLALVCNVHIPLAQGKPVATPSSSTLSLPNASAGSPQSSAPMTSNDVAIIFRNISDISSFSSQLVKRLETSFECVPNDGAGNEERLGKLFLEIIPDLERLYKTYLRTHPTALTRLQRLSLSPAYWRYSSDIQNLLSSGARIPDLPSLLMRPEQRVPEYCRLLSSVIHTPLSSSRRSTALLQARVRMDKLVMDLNDNKKVSSSILPVKSFPTPSRTNTPIPTETNRLAQLESRLNNCLVFLDRLAECVKDWTVTTRRSVESLQQWGITFGAALGFASPLAPYPYAYKAFISLLSSLQGLCTTLEEDLETSFHLYLHKLKATTVHPKQLLSEMHSLESSRTPSSLTRFWRLDPSKNHQHYLSLQSALSSQLPLLLDAMERASELAVHVVTQRQVAFFKAVRNKWIAFFNSLNEESEYIGGTGETLRAWQERQEVVRQRLLTWEESYISGVSAIRKVRPSSQSETNPPVRLSAMLAELPSVNGMSPAPSAALPQRRMRFSFPPSSRPSSQIRHSVASVGPVPYTVRAIQSYNPPSHGLYRGHSFFKLADGDCFEVLEEHDHPSAHADLPRCFVSKKDKDCLLRVRARNIGTGYEVGDEGWVLARFVSAD